MITYSWRITGAKTETTYEGYADFLKSVQYELTGTNDDGTIPDNEAIYAIVDGWVDFEPNPGATYIPGNELTDEIVQVWINDALGPDKIAELEAEVADMIANAPKV